MKIWNIWPTETEGWVCLRRLAQINTIITCENGHPMTLSLYYFSDSTQWKCSKKSPRSWALDKQGISIYANKGMGMNKSFEHLGCLAVYVRNRKYAHYFLNYFSHQFLKTYNLPPMLIHHRMNTRLFQLTFYDSITCYVLDAGSARWSHKTNKYRIYLFVFIYSFSYFVYFLLLNSMHNGVVTFTSLGSWRILINHRNY